MGGNMNRFRTYLLMVAACIFLVSSVNTACAGDINSAEQQVLDYASGTFEYEGSTYRAYPEYISQLRDHFMKDDIDMSQSEVPALIGDIKSNVKAGIDEGYLYLVSDPGTTSEQTASEEATSKDTVKHTDKKFKIEDSIKNDKIFYQDEKKQTTAVSMVIKNTGYTVRPLIVTGVGLVLLLLAGVCLCVRYDLFAPGDES